MTAPHLLSLGIHILAGVVGIGIGLFLVVSRKGDQRHRRMGRWFIYCALTVTTSAWVGTFVFRFLPLFAVLALLVTYVTVGGWRTARTQSHGPSGVDLAWTALGVLVTVGLVPSLLAAPHTGSSQPVVVWSSLAALGIVLVYDLARWTFPRRWFRVLWLPEHVYKGVSALSGLVSAFMGNTVRWGQPWSQIAPSVIGTVLIGYFVWLSLTRARRSGAL